MSKIGKKELALREQREKKVPSLKAVQKAKANMAMMKAPSPKDQLVVALALPDDGSVPEFLKRTETEEQAMNRRKKYAVKDKADGLKVVHFEPTPEKIRKAIAKDLGEDESETIPVADLHKSNNPKAKENAKSWDKIRAIAKAGKKAVKLPKPDPMERKLAEAIATKKQPIAVHGPDLPNGPGLARLRASPKAEAIRKDNLKKIEKASAVKKEKPTLTGKKAILFDTAIAAGKKGITLKALAKKVGWERCSYTLKQVCQQMNAKLEVRDDLVFVTK